MKPRKFMNEIQNAKITSTSFGTEDHGILTCWLFLEGDGWGCGFGGYAFDAWDEQKKKRFATAYGTRFMQRIMEIVGVAKWEDLSGKHLRAKTEGLGGGVLAIGNFLKNEWFDPKAEEDFLMGGIQP